MSKSEKFYRYDKTEKGFDIVEIPTGLIVKQVKDSKEAVTYVVRLNKLRTGFQGNTPPFFAVR